jgi:hypothetical protein
MPKAERNLCAWPDDLRVNGTESASSHPFSSPDFCRRFAHGVAQLDLSTESGKKGVDKKTRVMLIKLLSGRTTKSIYPTLSKKSLALSF